MCGFVGFTGSCVDRERVLRAMCERIKHRGPDMSGEYFDDEIALGFRRLSIIDLSEAAAQPMTNSGEDSSIEIVYNGEVYNFMSLRTELEASGHRFVTRSDTEVLIHCYEEYGERMVDKLRGMFAFVIRDKRNNRLFGARDIFGIKPFYYGRLAGGELIFGSEIKSFIEHPAFIKKVNKNALLPYLTFQYSAQEETFFEGVYKLPQSHFFVYENGEMRIERYHDIKFSRSSESFDEATEHLNSVINESVAAHRIADVKVGTFLSGGIDSSYITASMMPNKTFSVGFEYNKFNETNYAKELSDILGISNYRYMISADDCFDNFADIQYHMDEPQSNPSCVPLYFLARLAREHVTVVLSGEGADEIFAGYEWYDETSLMRKYKRLPNWFRVGAASVAKKLPYFKGHDFIVKSSGRPEDWFIGQAHVWDEADALELVNPEYRNAPRVSDITTPIYKRVSGADELIKKQYLDLNLWLPGDILLKADKMSMAHSLELRVPFLDKEVMDYAATIPSEYKINELNTKYILRRASAEVLPDEWVNRTKLGFPVPIRHWLCDDKYSGIVRDYFTSDFAAEFFDCGKLMALLDSHKSGAANNGRRIWTVFTFLVWYKRFFID